MLVLDTCWNRLGRGEPEVKAGLGHINAAEERVSLHYFWGVFKRTVFLKAFSSPETANILFEAHRPEQKKERRRQRTDAEHRSENRAKSLGHRCLPFQLQTKGEV